MLPLPDEAEVLARLVAWGEANEGIRALILTSSRARRDETVDALSDYDVIVAVRDLVAFARDDSWARAVGRPLAGWGDESEVLGLPTSFRGVVYEDAVKVDFTLWPVELLERVAASPVLPDDLDVGYRVLLDKHGATARWQDPTFRAHVPARPTRAEYDAQVEEFWWSTTYAAKGLWRGEVVFVKFVLDFDSKLGPLRRFLEWRIELDRDWSLRPGAYGRGLERLLPPDLRDELASTYVGAGVEDNWNALFRTTALFRRVATEVGDALGYRYPQEIDDAVTEQLRAVRSLPPRMY
jgi:aminoglycoside 6-adenylyltransferase